MEDMEKLSPVYVGGERRASKTCIYILCIYNISDCEVLHEVLHAVIDPGFISLFASVRRCQSCSASVSNSAVALGCLRSSLLHRCCEDRG